jgi:hypothetical protein
MPIPLQNLVNRKNAYTLRWREKRVAATEDFDKHTVEVAVIAFVVDAIALQRQYEYEDSPMYVALRDSELLANFIKRTGARALPQ